MMMMNFMYTYTKTIKEADTHKLERETTKELAKSMSYSVRVWKGRCDNSA